MNSCVHKQTYMYHTHLTWNGKDFNLQSFNLSYMYIHNLCKFMHSLINKLNINLAN